MNILIRLLNKLVDNGEHYKYPRGTINIVIAMEELSELIKELSKCIRGECNIDNLMDEIVDVMTSLYQLPYILGMSMEEFDQLYEEKLRKKRVRILERLNEEAKGE